MPMMSFASLEVSESKPGRKRATKDPFGNLVQMLQANFEPDEQSFFRIPPKVYLGISNKMGFLKIVQDWEKANEPPLMEKK